jgi:hypothetical protein
VTCVAPVTVFCATELKHPANHAPDYPPIARRARDEHVVPVMLTITEQSDGPSRIADDSFNWFAGRHSDDGGCRRLVGEVCFDCVTSNEQRASSNRKDKDCATQVLLMRRPNISRIETCPSQGDGKSPLYLRFKSLRIEDMSGFDADQIPLLFEGQACKVQRDRR